MIFGLNASLPFQWSAKFSPVERMANPNAVAITDGAEWFIMTVAGAGGVSLFVLAGHRQSRGDLLGAALSFLGAVCFAAAPYVARKFI